MQKIILDEVNSKAYMVVGEGVSVDTKITPELKMEGDARDFIRAVQELRKQKGLAPQDRISLKIQTSDGGEAVMKAFETEIKRVVGADSIDFTNAEGEEITAGDHSFTVELNVL
jgi:isoleucyl-tRNA synthetase